MRNKFAYQFVMEWRGKDGWARRDAFLCQIEAIFLESARYLLVNCLATHRLARADGFVRRAVKAVKMRFHWAGDERLHLPAPDFAKVVGEECASRVVS
ncbi:MAG: hypothetical protein NZQ09_15700, partial [Chloroflexus sp.]|nr:hypothetical protein [Chloroflexus sp.]